MYGLDLSAPLPNADPGNEMGMVAFSKPPVPLAAAPAACFALLRPGQGKVTHNPIRSADLLLHAPDNG